MNGAAGGMMGGMPGAGHYAGMMGPMSPQMAAGMGYGPGGAGGCVCVDVCMCAPVQGALQERPECTSRAEWCGTHGWRWCAGQGGSSAQ